jgi:hypothetical protein
VEVCHHENGGCHDPQAIDTEGCLCAKYSSPIGSERLGSPSLLAQASTRRKPVLRVDYVANGAPNENGDERLKPQDVGVPLSGSGYRRGA